jgi:hypothetical protein
MSRRWSVAEVRPITGEQERFQHVARHLYRPAERWEQLVPGLGDARGFAWACGCSESLLDGQHPDVGQAAPACKAHVLGDHDHRYAPAYMAELLAADTAHRWGDLPGGPPGLLFVGDAGVTVIVRTSTASGCPVPRVVSAYRPIPFRGTTREDFFKKAVRKLRDKTSWRGE